MVEISRFEQLTFSENTKFYTRVFTQNEIDYCLSFSSPAPHFAANFAGKEAVFKAVNKFCDLKLNQIEILRAENGSPHIELHLSPEENVDQLDVKVSLSHSLSHAIAFAVARKQAKPENSNDKSEALLANEI